MSACAILLEDLSIQLKHVVFLDFSLNVNLELSPEAFPLCDAEDSWWFLIGFWHEQECIMGALQLKTVVYVTHQMEFLPSADLILVGQFSLHLMPPLKFKIASIEMLKPCLQQPKLY